MNIQIHIKSCCSIITYFGYFFLIDGLLLEEGEEVGRGLNRLLEDNSLGDPRPISLS